MKILHAVESYYPSVGGMQEVVRQLSERLVLSGHQVTVATKKYNDRNFEKLNGVEIKEFSVGGNLICGIHGESEKYRQFLLQSDFDVVTFFAAQQWAADLGFSILSEIKAKKIFVPTGFSMLHNFVYAEYYEQMKSWLKQFDMNIFLSEEYRDVNFAKENGIKKYIIIPNGADEREFSVPSEIKIRNLLNISENEFLILHVGSFTGFKGQQEALEIYLKSDIRNGFLLFIGNNFNLLKKNRRFIIKWMYLLFLNFFKRKKFKVIYMSREATIAAFKEADLFLFPSNIECSPLVLFECMAAKLPYLVTDVGNSKEIIKWSNGGELLSTRFDKYGYSHADISSSVKQLNELYSNKIKMNSLAVNGYNSWKEKYSWEIIAGQYETLYLSLLKNKE